MTAAIRTSVATWADLEALPEAVRGELIGGVIIEKAAPTFEHGNAQGALAAELMHPFQHGRGGPGGWWIATEVEVELEDHEIYRPDLLGWRRTRVPERPRGRPIRLHPDWVCEILSPTNADNDLGKKLFAYHRAGVPHYWILDPAHETLTVYRWSAEGYVVQLTAGRAERVRALPFDAIELEVALLFGG